MMQKTKILVCSGEIQHECSMGQLDGYFASSPAGSDAGNMSPSQKMLVAAVRLGISDARGINRISAVRQEGALVVVIV